LVNPVLERLGYKPGDHLAIVHADDVGMCHAANAAFWEDQAYGIVTCGSVMMPCPWVPEMAAWCRDHPQADVGVHLTLNSEWAGYRWPPLSTRDPQSGLVDPEGYMWRSVEALHRHMDVDAAIAEMRVQVELALAMGIDVTHIDTHMGAVAHPELWPAYMALAVEYRLPAMLPRLDAAQVKARGISPQLGQSLMAALDGMQGRGFPVLDGLRAASEQGDHLQVYCRLFDSLPPGITHLLLHPAIPGYDIEAITDSAPYRTADYQTFLRPELKAYIADQGIHLIGYRHLRDLIRNP
jgi:predicted glycoside hydrolase/deacetylase ChbG (UPF0249 family)